MKKNVIGLIGHDSLNLTLNIARSLKKLRENCRIIDLSESRELLTTVNPDDFSEVIETEYFGIPVAGHYSSTEDDIVLCYFGMNTNHERIKQMEYIVCETDIVPSHLKRLRKKSLLEWANGELELEEQEPQNEEPVIEPEPVSIFRDDEEDEEEGIDVFPEFRNDVQKIMLVNEIEEEQEEEEIKPPTKKQLKRKPIKSDKFTVIFDDYVTCRFDSKYIFQMLGITPEKDKCYKIALNKKDTVRRIYFESTLFTSGQVAMSDTYKAAFLYTLQNILGRKLKRIEIGKITK